MRINAQTDSVKTEGVKDKKSVYSRARKATIMSAVLPGLGQIYNKKYWKTGVIYAGLGGLGYLFYVTNSNYNEYRSALILSQDSAHNGFAYGYSTSALSSEKNRFRRYRDLTIIGMAAVYILNIVDANVDAHLTTFDVSDDLGIRIDPWQGTINNGQGIKTANGLSIKLIF